MSSLNELYQSGDWANEKHVPAIDAPDTVKKGDVLTVKVAIGKEIAHPNTTEHHICWINVYFQPDGEKFPVEIGKYSFDSHGASAKGPNTSTIYTDPSVTINIKTEKSGTVLASSYCNIHGLWTQSKKVTVS